MDAWMPMLGLCVHADEHPREKEDPGYQKESAGRASLRLVPRPITFHRILSPVDFSRHATIFLAVCCLLAFGTISVNCFFLHRIPQSNAAQHALCARNHAHVKLI